MESIDPFVHLHVHSQYSRMRGVSSLEEICRAVKSQGSDVVALTDTNGLYGAIRFVEVAERNGLKPILGAELVHGSHRAVLLAKAKKAMPTLIGYYLIATPILHLTLSLL